jgi:hypothetical protein
MLQEGASSAAAAVSLFVILRSVWWTCRLESGALKHSVEDDFDPDGMGIALNLSMNYEVARPSASAWQ